VLAGGQLCVLAAGDVAGDADEPAEVPEQEGEVALPAGAALGLEDDLLDMRRPRTPAGDRPSRPPER